MEVILIIAEDTNQEIEQEKWKYIVSKWEDLW